MFRKFKIILVGLAAVFAIVAFIFFQDEQDHSIQDISPPETSIDAIQGTWKIKKINSFSENDQEPLKENTRLYISKELVAFGDRYTLNPSIKSKFVSLDKYFDERYRIEKIDDKKQKPIYTIYDGTRFSQDVILYNKDQLLVIYNGKLYELERTDKKIAAAVVKKYNKLYEESNGENSFSAISEDLGLQIGIRQRSDSGEALTYRTYFVKIPKSGNVVAYLTEDLVFHRDDGLWKAKYGQENKQNKLVIEPFVENMKPTVNNVLYSKTPMEITYLDANFISLSHQDSGSYVYRFYHLDGLNPKDAYSLLNIAGEEGKTTLENILTAELFSEEDKKNLTVSNYKNIGIKRSEGRWTFVTNLIDPVDQTKETLQTKDLKLNIVPKIDVRIEEKEPPLKWIDIKNLSKDAIDAYFSPNNNVLIIQTTDELLIYRTQYKVKPIATIPFSKNDRIVMCQWAMDKYADIWEKEFSKTPRLPISYNAQ